MLNSEALWCYGCAVLLCFLSSVLLRRCNSVQVLIPEYKLPLAPLKGRPPADVFSASGNAVFPLSCFLPDFRLFGLFPKIKTILNVYTGFVSLVLCCSLEPAVTPP